MQNQKIFPYFQRIDDFIRDLLLLQKSSIRKILIYVSDRTADKTTIVINAICNEEMKISIEVENSLGNDVIDEFYINI